MESNLKVIVFGAGAVGVEVMKSLALQRAVNNIFFSDHRDVTADDVALCSFYKSEDIGKNRATVSCQRLEFINPNVSLITSDCPTIPGDIQLLEQFLNRERIDVVVLTETDFATASAFDNLLRNREPAIPFVAANAFGVISWLFVDGGPQFQCLRPEGRSLSKGLCLEINFNRELNKLQVSSVRTHGLEIGSRVSLFAVSEVIGEKALASGFVSAVENDSLFVADVTEFSESEFNQNIESGGYVWFRQENEPQMINYRSLDEVLETFSGSNCDRTCADSFHCRTLHSSILALDTFHRNNSRYPSSVADSVEVLRIVRSLSPSDETKHEEETLVKNIIETSGGHLPVLSSLIGSIAAFEVHKLLTREHIPLSGGIRHFCGVDILLWADEINSPLHSSRSPPPSQSSSAPVSPTAAATVGCDHSHLGQTLGPDLIARFRDSRLLLVGAGEIGCALLRLLSSIGGCREVAVADSAIVTEHCLATSSLFTIGHVGMNRAEAAKDALSDRLNIALPLPTPSPNNENLLSDTLLETFDIVFSAADDASCHRYMDARCVGSGRPFIDLGADGACLGHVEVCVPHRSKTCSDFRDPPPADVPHCVLKSFPFDVTHCVQWSRNKCRALLQTKPNDWNMFVGQSFAAQSSGDSASSSIDSSVLESASKMSPLVPITFECCLRFSRIKFEKYFRHKALRINGIFPADNEARDGGKNNFWSAPKVRPRPLTFDVDNQAHVDFVKQLAMCWATLWRVLFTRDDVSHENTATVLQSVAVPEFVFDPTTRIETDEHATIPTSTSKRNPDGETADSTAEDDRNQCISTCQSKLIELDQNGRDRKCDVHLLTESQCTELVVSFARLRAQVYNIPSSQIDQIRQIIDADSSRCDPVAATVVASLGVLEALKLFCVTGGGSDTECSRGYKPGLSGGAGVSPHSSASATPVTPASQADLRPFRNSFVNLGRNVFVQSSPLPVDVRRLANGSQVSKWTVWHLDGNDPATTVRQLIDRMRTEYGVEVTTVMHDNKMVYVPFMPGHAKRLSQRLLKFLKVDRERVAQCENGGEALTVNLSMLIRAAPSAAAASETDNGLDNDDDDEENCPVVRFSIDFETPSRTKV